MASHRRVTLAFCLALAGLAFRHGSDVRESGTATLSVRSDGSVRAGIDVGHPAVSDDRTFTVTSMNILARSLGSSTIPWVNLIKDDELLKAIRNATGLDYNGKEGFKVRVLRHAYMKCFHKNTKQFGNEYVRMRVLWGASPDLETPQETKYGEGKRAKLNQDMTTVTLQQYGDDKEWSNIAQYDTMHGLLRKEKVYAASTLNGIKEQQIDGLGPDLGEKVWQYIIADETKIFRWGAVTEPHTRAWRVFQEAFFFNLVKDGSGKPLTDPKKMQSDIVAFQEFDVHQDLIGNGSQLSQFVKFANKNGYSYAFFPGIARTIPPGHLAIFWDSKKFCASTTTSQSNSNKTKPLPKQLPVQVYIDGKPVNIDLIEGQAYNMDMDEKWHKEKDADGNFLQEAQRMRDQDRRNVGFMRLRHRSTNRPLLVINAHLMTDSRDKKGLNKFPGEIRAGEIAAIKKLTRQIADPDPKAGEAIVWVGDFNVDAEREAKQIFSGKFQNGDDHLSIPTGLVQGQSKMKFHWEVGASSHVILTEAFENVHRWGENVGPDAQATSSSAKRPADWIDYIWTSNNLKVVALSNTDCPSQTIPDATHGSDHIAVHALVDFDPIK